MQNLSAQLLATVDTAEPHLLAISEHDSGMPILPGGWSRKQALGHLIDSASNNHQRFVRAALQDTLEFPAYDQDGCVRIAAPQEARWTTLVALWASYNRYLAHIIAHLPDAKLAVVCRIGSNQPVTLRFLAEDYLHHLSHHLEQLGIRAAATAN